MTNRKGLHNMRTALLLTAWAWLTAYVSVAQLAAGKWHDRAHMAASWCKWGRDA